MTPQTWYMTVDHVTDKPRPQNKVLDVLLMNNKNQKYLSNFGIQKVIFIKIYHIIKNTRNYINVLFSTNFPHQKIR